MLADVVDRIETGLKRARREIDADLFTRNTGCVDLAISRLKREVQ